MRLRHVLACLALLVSTPLAAAELIPLDHFLTPGQFNEIKISPDGQHLAATVPLADRTALVVLRRKDMVRTGHAMFGAQQHVTDFHWANARQLVYTESRKLGWLAAPVSMGYLYRMNVDGTENQPVSKASLRLVSTLPEDDENILVGFTSVSSRTPISRMNLQTGKVEVSYMRWPIDSGVHHVDNAGKIRFLSGTSNNELTSRLYQRDDDGQWHLVNVEKDTGFHVYVMGFSSDNQTAYFIIEDDELTDGFYAHDMKTRERRLLARHPRVDVAGTLRSPLDGGIIALQYLDGLPELQVIQPDDAYAREMQRVQRAFPGSYVTPTSSTRDGSLTLYAVSSDVNSGEYYLVDHKTGQATFVAARDERLDPGQMAPMQSHRFKARDGLELQAYLTMPRGISKGAPLVVMPHGGPKGLYDSWGFDHEVQMLASRGYAVLQVNFRGSGNFGRKFRESGNGEWGAKMQDDLTDATNWALRQGYAAPGRVCLYGASYGAYAAMMGLVREPGTYACGIGNVGIYDLQRMYRNERRFRDNKDYFDEALGDVDLASISPVRLARAIRAPVLLGAGELDGTAPVGQTRSMHQALKRLGVPVEYAEYAKEGHGYYKYEHRLDWAKRVLAHLDKTIGAGRAAPVAAN
ncbi:MAG: prolyl oligopeptidase family serine peptidase [Arenimonas sp.]|nr:prolyl oligopeptidase family serine peptidase [Arenimonas sp.]